MVGWVHFQNGTIMILTDHQLADFYSKGYLRIKDLVPTQLLLRLRDLFDKLMSEEDTDGKVMYENNGNVYITNIEQICRRGNLACLELLGYPPILQIAQSICGPDFFMIQEFAVNKILGDDLPVLWHLDMVNGRSGHCVTMGIYLDDADEGDGALQVVPGSHTSGKSICELSRSPSIEIPMKAGDVLVHDMMIAHKSDPLRKNPLRRVIYFEFLPASQVFRESIYPKEVVDRRTRLLFAATRLYQSLHPTEDAFLLPYPNPNLSDDAKPLASILHEVYNEPINPRPSSYCLDEQSIFS